MTKTNAEKSHKSLPQQGHSLSQLHCLMSEDDYSALQLLTFAIKGMAATDNKETSPALGAMLMAGKALLPHGMNDTWVEDELGLPAKRGRVLADQAAGWMWAMGDGWAFNHIEFKPSRRMFKRLAALGLTK